MSLFKNPPFATRSVDQDRMENNIMNPHGIGGRTKYGNGLVENIFAEAIHMNGSEFVYLRREYQNTDILFGEDPTGSFNLAYPVVMYIEDAVQYAGQRDFYSKFGIQVNDEINLSTTPDLFTTQCDGQLPQVGDLVYFPMGKALFEIVWVENEDIFYYANELPKLKIRAEKYIYSGESIGAYNDSPIDNDPTIFDDIELLNDKEDIATEEPMEENEAIQSESDKLTDWSEINPFGDKV